VKLEPERKGLNDRRFPDGEPAMVVGVMDRADSSFAISPCENGRRWLVWVGTPMAGEVAVGHFVPGTDVVDEAPTILAWLGNAAEGLAYRHPPLAEEGIASRVSRLWKGWFEGLRDVIPRTQNNDPPPVLRDSEVCRIEQTVTNAIPDCFEVLGNHCDDSALAHAEQTADVFGDNVTGSFVAYDANEFEVELIPFVLSGPPKVGPGEALTRETADHDVAVRDIGRRDGADVAVRDMQADVAAVAIDAVFVDVVGPDYLMTRLNEPQVKAAGPREERHYLHGEKNPFSVQSRAELGPNPSIQNCLNE